MSNEEREITIQKRILEEVRETNRLIRCSNRLLRHIAVALQKPAPPELETLALIFGAPKQ